AQRPVQPGGVVGVEVQAGDGVQDGVPVGGEVRQQVEQGQRQRRVRPGEPGEPQVDGEPPADGGVQVAVGGREGRLGEQAEQDGHVALGDVVDVAGAEPGDELRDGRDGGVGRPAAVPEV